MDQRGEAPVPIWERMEGDHEAGTHFSQCNECVWRWPAGRACDAFPEGIPLRVRVNEVPHDHPLPEMGQNNRLTRHERSTPE